MGNGNQLITADKAFMGGKKRTITTLEIAEMMGTPHYKILRKLEGTKNADGSVKQIGIIPVLTGREIPVSDYFLESVYKDASGKENRCYDVTKLGCEFLASKFTGEEGMLFTVLYVKRFNEMEPNVPRTFNETLLGIIGEILEGKTRS